MSVLAFVHVCIYMYILDYLNFSGSVSGKEQSLREEEERKAEATRVQLLNKRVSGKLSTLVFTCFMSTYEQHYCIHCVPPQHTLDSSSVFWLQ